MDTQDFISEIKHALFEIEDDIRADMKNCSEERRKFNEHVLGNCRDIGWVLFLVDTKIYQKKRKECEQKRMA